MPRPALFQAGQLHIRERLHGAGMLLPARSLRRLATMRPQVSLPDAPARPRLLLADPGLRTGALVALGHFCARPPHRTFLSPADGFRQVGDVVTAKRTSRRIPAVERLLADTWTVISRFVFPLRVPRVRCMSSWVRSKKKKLGIIPCLLHFRSSCRL